MLGDHFLQECLIFRLDWLRAPPQHSHLLFENGFLAFQFVVLLDEVGADLLVVTDGVLDLAEQHLRFGDLMLNLLLFAQCLSI